MKRYTDSVASSATGEPVPNAQVRLFRADGSSVTLYSDDGVTPISAGYALTDGLGSFFFYVADGTYTRQIKAGSQTLNTPNVEIYEEAATAALAQRAVLTAIGQTPPTVDLTGASNGQVLSISEGIIVPTNPTDGVVQNTIGTSTTIAPSQAAVAAALSSLLSGQSAFTGLPDEANNDTIPAPGSGLPYLSGGVLKIA